MAQETLCVVEDEDDIRELISYNLAKEGYRVRGFASGEEALAALPTLGADLVILDVMLPGMDGFSVCREIRKLGGVGNIPVVMLTARGEEIDVVSGLEIGADDYLVKPFSPRVLSARIRAQLRRTRPQKNEESVAVDKIIDRDGLIIHPGMRTVTVDEQPVKLTASEFKALAFLAEKPGWVFSRYQIMEAVHGENYIVTDRSIDVLIAGLRKKLGSAENRVETVRGTGYTFR